jgi:D-sedoheptulose 7-phosphate isomerase
MVYSTSGNSGYIVKAFEAAKAKQMIMLVLQARLAVMIKSYVITYFNIPSKDTPRIQESHIMIGHIICELVETKLFS